MKTKYFFFCLWVFPFLSSCTKVEKNINDYYPLVKTISAIVLPDGTVEVKGRIISEGSSPITHVGFCSDTLGSPKMLSNQIIAKLDGDEFSAIYLEFNMYKKYYFRSWASNGNGYSYGEIIYLENITPINVTPPCTLDLNTVDMGLGNPIQNFYLVTSPEQATLNWELEAHANSCWYEFYFGSFPKTKIYDITTSSSPENDEVQVCIYSNYFSGYLSTGNLVYVEQTDTNSWVISFCEIPWTVYGSLFYQSAKFTCPL